MTNYERGRQYEYKSMRWLEVDGYETFRAAGSHGVFDVGGINRFGLVLVQVKFNCDPTPAEMEQFKLFPAPHWVCKIIHRWDYRKSKPKVIPVN